jgi:hypothetical protein
MIFFLTEGVHGTKSDREVSFGPVSNTPLVNTWHDIGYGAIRRWHYINLHYELFRRALRTQIIACKNTIFIRTWGACTVHVWRGGEGMGVAMSVDRCETMMDRHTSQHAFTCRLLWFCLCFGLDPLVKHSVSRLLISFALIAWALGHRRIMRRRR